LDEYESEESDEESARYTEAESNESEDFIPKKKRGNGKASFIILALCKPWTLPPFLIVVFRYTSYILSGKTVIIKARQSINNHHDDYESEELEATVTGRERKETVSNRVTRSSAIKSESDARTMETKKSCGGT